MKTQNATLRKRRLLSVRLQRVVYVVRATLHSVCEPGCCSDWDSGRARSWLCYLRCRYYWGLASILICIMFSPLEPQYAPVPSLRHKAVRHDLPRKCRCIFRPMELVHARDVFEADCFVEKGRFELIQQGLMFDCRF